MMTATKDREDPKTPVARAILKSTAWAMQAHPFATYYSPAVCLRSREWPYGMCFFFPAQAG